MRMNAADNIIMVVAFSTHDGEMALWPNSMFFLPLIVAITDLITMNSVVVLIPPPVELGEPPIKIANKIRIIVEICIKLISSTLKPEVRQVTTWKMVVKTLLPKPSIPFNVLLYSNRKKRMLPIMMIAKVT